MTRPRPERILPALSDSAGTAQSRFEPFLDNARPVQERVPVKMGAMRGPKSFEVAGEFSDGCHHCLSYTRQAYEYAFEHFRAGAESAKPKPKRRKKAAAKR